jgi:triacylglycerol lipase
MEQTEHAKKTLPVIKKYHDYVTMSIATLKRKTTKGGNPRADPISGVGNKGFSLNGGHRNIGAVGQFRMVSNVTRTPFRGTEPMGHGGFDGEYYNHPVNSGDCCTNDDSVIKHSSLNTAGLIDKKYKWTKSQYPRYWVKDDDNANRMTKTQGQLTAAKTWASGACNFEKAANDDPDNVWKCNNKCVYWIGGKKKFVYYPYSKWLNTTKVQSQGTYITAGGVARQRRLPTPSCMQHYPMMLSANGCDSSAVTWQQAQAQGLLPPNYMTCEPIDGESELCKSQNNDMQTNEEILSNLYAYILVNDPDSLVDMPTSQCSGGFEPAVAFAEGDVMPASHSVEYDTCRLLSYDPLTACELNKMSNLTYEMLDYYKANRNNLSNWTLPVSAPRFPFNKPRQYMYSVYDKTSEPIGFIIESAINADGVVDIYFVWRGTKTLSEWIQNSKFLPDNFYGTNVFKGFHQVYSNRISSNTGPTPREVVINYVQTILARPSQNKYTLWFTGHSLGGALALLSSYETMKILDSNGNPSNINVIMYNFASPRVGNITFVNSFNDKTSSPFQGPTSWRITNKNDFVPKIPPEFLGYRHVEGHHEIEFGKALNLFTAFKSVIPNHNEVVYLKELLKEVRSNGFTIQQLIQRNIQYTADELSAAGF